MAANEALQRLQARESTEGLWDRTVLGFPVWSLLRLGCYRQEALRDQPEAASASVQLRGLARFAAELRVVCSSLRDLLRGGPATRAARDGRDLWVLSNTTYRRPGPDGQAPCIFASHLVEQLGDRVLFLEFNAARLPSQARDDVCFLDAFQVPLLVAARLASRLLAPVFALTHRAQLAPFAPVSPGRVLDRALYGRFMLKLGRSWMRRSPPRAVFVLCGYHMHTPLQLAAREQGIPVIELQHGLIHESHPGYILPDLPEPKLRSLPLPDHLVVFGSYFGTMLEGESARWMGRWTTGGHRWLQRRRAEAERAAGHADGSPSVSGDAPAPRRRLVLFSQYELDVRIQVQEAAVAARAALPEDWLVTIKPHPREFDADSFYGPALEAGVELMPIVSDSYALLARVDVAVTVYSTLAIEALAFACRSVVLPSDRWTPAIADLVKRGLLESCANGTQLAALAQGDRAGEVDRGDVAGTLFGIDQDPIDFDALVTACSASST